MICKHKVKKFCSEDISLIENYDKAVKDKQTWHCHHRLEIQDDKIMSVDDLKNAGLYFQRPAKELIFLTPTEHKKLHSLGKSNPMYGKHFSEETKQKMRKPKSEEHKQKLSKAKKDTHLSEEHKQKISKGNKGKLKGISKLKFNWLIPTGEIRIMDKANAKRFHPDWKLIE